MLKLDFESSKYRLYKVTETDFPINSYIICTQAASQILYNPQLAGKDLQDKMLEVAEVFTDAIYKKILIGKKPQQIAELIFLAGGLYYQLNGGFKNKLNMALPQCFLGIKRQRVEGTDGEFTAIATYENFESLPNNGTIIIGDTIATGATLQKGIYHLFEILLAKKYNLENLVVCSLACSVIGAKKLLEIENQLKKHFPNAKVHLFVAEEFFHLMPDGTDLRFLYEEAIMPQETQKRILTTYGKELGKEMKCAVFDWGTRCKNPLSHYNEFLEFAAEIKHQLKDKKSIEIIDKMEKETKEKLKIFENPL